jgi:alkyl sulfatase BDS1-like metallo-beta-lactamase superfamily hydrolase
MSASKLLKDRANEAFKAKEFENAIELYNQAIAAEKSSQSKDAKLLSLICSNLAQTYLELKQ